MSQYAHSGTKAIVTLAETAAFDRGTNPILRFLSVDQAQKLVKYQPEESLHERIAHLANQPNEGQLSADERAEYEGYIRANKFVAVLQAQARKLLQASASQQ